MTGSQVAARHALSAAYWPSVLKLDDILPASRDNGRRIIDMPSLAEDRMLPLTILYQDDDLVAVHKPAGLLVHRSQLARGEREFLLQRLRNQLKRRVYPVHRLDRPTSGVMVFGFSSEIAARLSESFAERQVEKRYLAVVRGVAPEQERLDYPLREEDGTRPKAQMPAMPAMTDIRRLDSVELPVQVDRYPVARYSLVETRPLTGRRHQIRRHLARRGYPIIGDAKHGKSVHNRFFAERFTASRLLLAATWLAFDHPQQDKRIQLGCALDDTMTMLFEHLGWAGHLPVDSVSTECS